MGYRAVVFDLFGTLVESPPMTDIEATVRGMSEELHAPQEEFRRLWFETNDLRLAGHFNSVADNLEHVCGELGVACTREQIAKAAEMVGVSSRRYLTRVQPEAMETMSALAERGLAIGLISDATSEVPKAWPDTPFAELISKPVFSCQVKVKKPDRRIYQIAADRLNVAVEECVYVGDGGSNELTGAAEAGMYPIMLAVPGQTDAAQVFRPGAQEWDGHAIASLSELLKEIG